MTDGQGFDVYLTPGFADRMTRLAACADADPAAAEIERQAMRIIRDLQSGSEIGHHALTDGSDQARGDLRDCTASQFRSRPEAKYDQRVIWRQLPARQPDGKPIRELIHIGPRHETPDAYQRTLAALGRRPDERVAANAQYGSLPAVSQKSRSVRTAVLEAQHAISLIRKGAAPLATSRPLAEYLGASAQASRSRGLGVRVR